MPELNLSPRGRREERDEQPVGAQHRQLDTGRVGHVPSGVVGLGDHDEASDLAQEVFIRVFRKIHLYRGDAAFSTWLYRVTSNLAKNRWKQMERQGRNRTISLDQPRTEDDDNRPLDQPDTAPGPRQEAEGRELLALTERELAALSFEHREVLVLRFVENLSYEEIAEAIGELRRAPKELYEIASVFFG